MGSGLEKGHPRNKLKEMTYYGRIPSGWELKEVPHRRQSEMEMKINVEVFLMI